MHFCHYHIAARATEAAEEALKQGYLTAADHDRLKGELKA